MPDSVRKVLGPFQSFVRSESAGGLLLIAAAVLAFSWANSPLAESYFALKAMEAGISFGAWSLEKPLILWVNDLLMAIFFLFVGLEIKRELRVGELADPSNRVLPVAAAVGGMVAPALVYASVHWTTGSGEGLAGWGVPMATDIAFALGVLTLLGDRVPLALKVFLTALAIVDDLGAVLVIALFYSDTLRWTYLALALGVWAAAWIYNRSGGRKIRVFLGLGILLWYFMLKSGVHATVAGVLLAFTVPLRHAIDPRRLTDFLAPVLEEAAGDHRQSRLERLETLVGRARSPLHELEHGLQPWVAFVIMPIFALFNAGFALEGGAGLGHPVALGAFLGLVVGKPLGIVGCCWLAVRFGPGRLPPRVGWPAITGASLLAGIGFTMSLFIAALAFGDGVALDDAAKLGVLAASVVAAVSGLLVLRWGLPRPRSPETASESAT